MQIAAAKPEYVRREYVSADVLEKEKEIMKNQAINEGKPEAVAEKIVAGKIDKYYADEEIDSNNNNPKRRKEYKSY